MVYLRPRVYRISYSLLLEGAHIESTPHNAYRLFALAGCPFRCPRKRASFKLESRKLVVSKSEFH